jgi:hypothetical protein
MKCKNCKWSREKAEGHPANVGHIMCIRYPEWVEKDDYYYCGEFMEGIK